MSTPKHFYRDRLGSAYYETVEENGLTVRDGQTTGADFKTYGGYEESLSKFKGIVYSLNIYHLIGMRTSFEFIFKNECAFPKMLSFIYCYFFTFLRVF